MVRHEAMVRSYGIVELDKTNTSEPVSLLITIQIGVREIVAIKWRNKKNPFNFNGDVTQISKVDVRCAHKKTRNMAHETP